MSRRWRLRSGAIPWGRTPPAHLDGGPPAGEGAARSVVVAVTGPPGAPGRSFTACHLAATLASRTPTVLVDADPVLGTQGTRLDLNPERSLWFLAHEAILRPLDGPLVQRHLQQSGPLAVLAGLDDPGEPGVCTPEVIVRVLTALRAAYQWVVVDTGALVGPLVSSVVRSCEGVLWTMVADELGVVAFDRTLRGRAAASAIGGQWEGIVCNRHGDSVLPHAVEDLEAQYGIPVVARIPLDPATAARSEIEHRSALGPSAMRRAFTDLALRLEAVAADRHDDVDATGRKALAPSSLALFPPP